MEKILEFIKSITEKRPVLGTRTEYGKYTSRLRTVEYSDRDKVYKNPAEVYSNNIEVHSIKAFTDYISEEFKRRNNATGKFATVQLGIEKSEFTADDDFNEGVCTYNRIKSEQLKQIQHYNGQELDQEDLIEMLLRLKPSIINYGFIANMAFCPFRITHNRIHRRTNIMAHVKEEL